jgi:ribosome biogenesis GTPase
VVSALEGVVMERDGAVYRVATADGEVRAILRGKMKRDMPKVVVGDRVTLDRDAGSGDTLGIAAVAERTSLLERRVPEGRGSRPVAANIDQVVVVTATRDPAPIPQLIDRLLVVAEANNLSAVVVLNKIDLDPGTALAARMTQAGYPVFLTACKSGIGLPALGAQLLGRTSVVTGPSGSGKSSLLNAIQPGLNLRVGDISVRVKRGRNTTVSAVMHPLPGGGFIVDTPGFSDVGLWGLEPRELASCFPELRPAIGECKFQDCRHTGEPGCAVMALVASGGASMDRVESYRVLLAEVEGEPKEWE